MKAVIFIHVLYLILIRTFMVKGDIKCGSKIEMRAVLLTCPTKDTGCDDDDPLSQTMNVDEAQLYQGNPKNFQSMKEEREREFPNAIKECKRKLIITLKVKNSGKIPCDDEYIVVDHVFDSITGRRVRLLSPVVLKLRQEQMVQLYGLQFQKAINSDPFEEQKECDRTCSVNPDNPTCGIAMYNGKPIPFSEGFCCSCDPLTNAKRQISSLSDEDSFLYKNFKLKSQSANRFSREEESPVTIINPKLVKLEPSAESISISGDNKCTDCSIKDICTDKILNFFLENDRRIICLKQNFMTKINNPDRNDKKSFNAMKFDQTYDKTLKEDFSNNAKTLTFDEKNGNENDKVEAIKKDLFLKRKPELAKSVNYLQVNRFDSREDSSDNDLNKALMLKNLINAMNQANKIPNNIPNTLLAKKILETPKQSKSEGVTRGKRENRQKLGQKLTLDEKLNQFIRHKSHQNRQKRLFEISHKRFRKAGIRCRDAEECEMIMVTLPPEQDYGPAPPPNYFFSLDKLIIDPLDPHQLTCNKTCKTGSHNQMDDEEPSTCPQAKPKCKNQKKDEIEQFDLLCHNLSSHLKKPILNAQKKPNKFRNKENFLTKVNDEKERVSHNNGGNIENSLKRKIKAQNYELFVRNKALPKNEINLNTEQKIKNEGLGRREIKSFNKNAEEDMSKKNLKVDNSFNNDDLKNDRISDLAVKKISDKRGEKEEKKSVKSKIRNFFNAKEKNKQKLESELLKSQGKEKADENEALEIVSFENEKSTKDNKKNEKLVKEKPKNEKLEKERDKNEKLEKEDIKEEKLEKVKGEKKEKENIKEEKSEKEKVKNKKFEYEKKNEKIEEPKEEAAEDEDKEKKTEESKNDEKEIGILNFANGKNIGNSKKNLKTSKTPSKEFTAEKYSKGELPSPKKNYMKLWLNDKIIGDKTYKLRPINYPLKEETKDIDFNVEIIREKVPEENVQLYAPRADQILRSHINVPKFQEETKEFNLGLSRNAALQGNRENPSIFPKNPFKYFLSQNDKYMHQKNGFLIKNGFNQKPDISYNERDTNEPEQQMHRKYESFRPKNRIQPFYYNPKPVKYFRVPYNKESSIQGTRKNYPKTYDFIQNQMNTFQWQDKFYPDIFFQKDNGFQNKISQDPKEEDVLDMQNSNGGKIRTKRMTEHSFESPKGFFDSELKVLESDANPSKIVHELENCSPQKKLRENGKIGQRNEMPIDSDQDDSDFNLRLLSSVKDLQSKFNNPLLTSNKKKDFLKIALKSNKITRSIKKGNDRERLIQSYLNAPEYVLKDMERGLKGKRQAKETENADSHKVGEKCEKEGGARETARCMRFGDLWYSVYMIKKPVIAQIVGIQLFNKHLLCDGTTQWRDLTKGKMVRVGTFLPKAEDELPTISMTYMGGKTKKVESAIDPDNYLLLIPTHISDPSKINNYPQFEGGPAEYLVVDSKDISEGNECNMVGTSFEAFARQANRCARQKGSCFKRQPIDLWREDMEARIRGKRGKYFVENFGTVPNSPVRTFTNITGEFLALEYYGEYTSTIEIEVKADYNAIIRRGSNAQIPTVYIDSTYPKKTRIILSVLNAGLTSALFRPRLGDCPPDLDPAWCPLEGPLVAIPPHQRHDFKLDLTGLIPPNKIHVTVEILNRFNKKVAYRKIVIKRGSRCVCGFHCKCICIGNMLDDRSCHKLSLEEYRGAGYMNSFPFRVGSAVSSSENIYNNFYLIFLTAAYFLLLLGIFKGLLGIFYRRLGIAGIRIIVGPRKLSKYYERELKNCPVLYDECGFPVHPTTCLPVQIVPLGLWFCLLSSACCDSLGSECDGCFNQSGNFEFDQKCSRPLLVKTPQPTTFNYHMTTLNTMRRKLENPMPYLPYKDDDDPLEEDDTEFVLQEMQRYRNK